MIVKELFTLARNVDEDRKMPLFRTKQWSFFLVATFYLYGRRAPHAVLYPDCLLACLLRRLVLVLQLACLVLWLGFVLARLCSCVCNNNNSVLLNWPTRVAVSSVGFRSALVPCIFQSNVLFEWCT